MRQFKKKHEEEQLGLPHSGYSIDILGPSTANRMIAMGDLWKRLDNLQISIDNPWMQMADESMHVPNDVGF